LFPYARRALALALVLAACSSGTASEVTTSAPVAAPSTSTSTSMPPPTTTTTNPPPPPTVTLRGPIPSSLKPHAERLYNHLIDGAGPMPAMVPGLDRYVQGHDVSPGVMRARGSVATLANGDRVGVVATATDGLVFVDPKGPRQHWRIVAAMLGDRPPWLGPDSLRNLVVIGSDARVGEDQLNLRADSIHILTLRTRQGTGALVGFPRDSWIQGSKLTDLMPGRGPEGMLQILEETTGLQLEGWVAVGFEGFLGLIGDLGNLEITLPTAMPSGNNWADYPEGEQSLDPQLTLRLARIRKDLPNGDLDRSVNQGRIILAALTMIQAQGLEHLPEWVASYSQHGFTSLGTRALVTFAAAAHVADPEAISNIVLPGSFGWVGAASVVFLGDAAQAIYADMADGLIGNN
jgi:anionic cell wall polymer biosynthesis LytR-Cps2A-Psr (LCP) family protein